MRTRTIRLRPGADLDGFRAAVRRLIRDDVAPDAVTWIAGEAQSLFPEDAPAAGPSPALALPRAVAALVPAVVMHRDPERYGLLHRLVRRVADGERHLAEVASDPLVHRLNLMRKAVASDLHKMHAFLRFRRAGTGEGGAGGRERFAAWFEPEHHILAEAAPFFSARFPSFDWSILTPDGSAHWDGRTLSFGPPGRREDVPEQDAFEAGWTDYYSSTFNPARTNLAAMRAEMPKKYWHNMPETAAIPGLVREAGRRVGEMIERAPEAPVKRVPARALAAMAAQEPASLAALNAVIRASEPLVPGATQAVLGEGPQGAAIAFVGEQPGDQEDLQGRPFVGPAGQLLARALREAGIDRERSYLTNAVKHFKFEARGKRRLHKSPTAGEVAHYRWWLDRELAFVAPRLVVALGATAVLALSGRQIPITRARGPAAFAGKPYGGFITVHPSYLLRLPDEARPEAYEAFVDDLRRAASLAAAPAGAFG
ncbi:MULTISPECIES: UdgX family uracil-DNA binding protein [Methylobacterium]|uniref:UdgX family uracil-DNA binding protein n=1 Tax=Methylobacterium TaxID=407 RepID=UPI0013EAE86D|nr:UdgX family uracil-DNA binding protein [Methylobacterium sp. DB0501]NGM37468.1 UdgX family uracil-DNA binding protein [Methylobacterium sp. DB0501]